MQNKHDLYRGKDCMKKFCEFLREHTMKIISLKEKKMRFLTKEKNVKILLYLQRKIRTYVFER